MTLHPLWLLATATVLGGCVHDRCDRHIDCDNDEICGFGTCEQALDRWYEVGVDAAYVGERHPDGLAWDVDGTDPDLFVDMLNESDWCSTSTRANTTRPVWVEYCTLWMDRTPELSIDLWDRDVHGDEFVAGWSWVRRDAVVQLARTDGALITLVDGTGTVEVDIWVMPR